MQNKSGDASTEPDAFWSVAPADLLIKLQTTALGIQVAFLNQPAEVPELRSQFQSSLGLGSALPQLLLRFGCAPALPHSLRRPVEEVIL